MTDDELRESLEWRLKDAQGRWLASEWTDFDVRANGIVADVFNGIFENRVRLALLDPELAKQPGYSDVTNVVTCGMPPVDPPVPVPTKQAQVNLKRREVHPPLPDDSLVPAPVPVQAIKDLIGKYQLAFNSAELNPTISPEMDRALRQIFQAAIEDLQEILNS